MESVAVCLRLAAFAGIGGRGGHVHSVFDHAINIECGERLVSVVQRPRGLVPYGCTVDCAETFPAMGIRRGMDVTLDNKRMAFAGGRVIGLRNAVLTDLSVEAIATDHTANDPFSGLRQVLRLLRAEGGTDGMSVLVTGVGTNVYADFIRPRLPELFMAVEAADETAAVAAVRRIAGCGIGLTPGSDDLLTGYFITIRLLSRLGRMRDARALLPAMAEAATQKTNRISGAFLIAGGEGLASEDFLLLARHVFFSGDEASITSAARRVAEFGSTSGRDMLTGMALAIQHHDGGKNSGKAGNPEKRVF